MAEQISSTAEIFLPIPSDSEIALVVFSGLGGGFHFFKVLEPLSHYTRLLVRDPARNWYNDGLPGVGDTIEEIAARIEREVEALGATRLVALGPSMGAYGAILFGCMLGAERVVALAPQTLLDPRLGLSPPADVELQAPDLIPVIRDAPETEIDLVAGWDDHLDVFHAQRVADLPSVRIIAVPGGQHSFVTDLHRRGALLPLVTALIEGQPPPAFYEVEPTLDPDTRERITDVAFATIDKDWNTVIEKLEPLANGHPSWAWASLDLGRALAETGDWPNAEAAFAGAVRANPDWAEAREALIDALRRQGRHGAAEQVARERPERIQAG